MGSLIQWFRQIFIEPSVFLAGTTINLFKMIGFLSILGVFVIIARFSRRFSRLFFARLKVEEANQERLVWLISIVVVLLGMIAGLAAIGIDLTVLGRVFTSSIEIGGTQLSLTKLIWFLGVVIGAAILSKYLQVVLRDQVLPAFHLQENAQFLLLRLVHIGIIMLGVLIGLNLAGLNLNSLMVVLGGLSIGLGFGLQNIASNLISGVILLFERPIRVGDRVTIRETYGTVTAINMRSTEIITEDNINIIVPNSQFISETITNWTHKDRFVRIKVPVGVAYGSDTALVKKALLEAANAHPQVVSKPTRTMPPIVKEPSVRFVSFGDSTLNFELLVWIPDVSRQFDIMSDLHFLVDQKFREYNIVIAFPQRDVHLYYDSTEICK